MIEQDHILDKYQLYEEIFDPDWQKPRERLGRNTRHRQPIRDEVLLELTDDLSDVNLGFSTTYKPSRHEASWLLSSLQSFYDEGLITDVLRLVKGGKEASVYCCQSHPATGLGHVAAKVYRPRMFRNLRNDKMYRQGREILTAGGRPAGRDSGYLERAIRSKTAFGQQTAHTSWLMYEFTAMERLHQAGGSVPRPIAANQNTVLMSYHGNEDMAAPTLNTVDLDPEEAVRLFDEILRNVDLLLRIGLVHGDLSPYNILYWAPNGTNGQVILIDFPQVVNAHTNPRAHQVLQRDLERICDYFAQQGLPRDPQAIFENLWRRHITELDPEEMAADQSRLAYDLQIQTDTI